MMKRNYQLTRPPSTLFKVNGATLSVIEAGPVDSSAIVFLHGGGPGCNAWSDWNLVGIPLSKEYRCVFVDLAQYGDSSREKISGKFFATQAGYLSEVLELLHITSAHFVCQSLGGSVALRLAADSPFLFKSIAMTGATPLTYGVLSRPAMMRVALDALFPYYAGEGPSPQKMRTLLARMEWYDESAIPDALVHERYRFSSRPDDIMIASDMGSRGEFENLDDTLDKVHAPVLLAYGDADPFAPPEVPLHLFSRLKSARLVLFKDASHHFPEEYPEKYLHVYRSWLTELVSEKMESK